MISQAILLEKPFVAHVKDVNNLASEQPIRAVTYTRVSTEMQPQSALESQAEVAKEFAEKNGIEIVASFSDRGISGTTDQRPQFQEMIKFSKDERNHIHLIVVYKLDRFFRNEQLHHVYEYELGKHGVFVLSATEETYKADMGTRMFKAFTLINNENEAIKIRQNVKRGQTHTARQGKTNGGIAPLGYDINSEGRYIVNKDEAEIIKQIFKMRHQGMTYVQMAEKLNKKHYKTKVGRSFTKNSFVEILSNPKYKGKFVYNRSVAVSEYGKRPNRHKYKDKTEIIEAEGQIEAIVSEKLWDSVQPKKAVSRKKGKGKYLLSGLVQCGECGEMYQVDTKKDIKYLRHNGTRKDACTALIQMGKVETSVINKVLNRIYSDESIDYFLNHFQKISHQQAEAQTERMKKLKHRIIQLKTQRDNYISSLSTLTDKETVAEVEVKIKETRRHIKELSEELEHLKNEIPQKPSREEVIKSKAKLRRMMKSPENQFKTRELLNRLVERVEIKKGKATVIFKC